MGTFWRYGWRADHRLAYFVRAVIRRKLIHVALLVILATSATARAFYVNTRTSVIDHRMQPYIDRLREMKRQMLPSPPVP